MTDFQKWFYFKEGTVHGPFELEEVKSRTSQLSDTLVWTQGVPEWVPPDQIESILIEFSRENKASMTPEEANRLWKLKVQGLEIKPMIYQELIEFLKPRNDLKEILIWTEGYRDYQEIFTNHRLIDDLGVSRRSHPRVPIMGSVQYESTRSTGTARALSVSEGGLGITETGNLRIGEEIKVLVKSPNLYVPIAASCEVCYKGNDDYAGLRFLSLPVEAKGAILDYVKKFSNS